MIGLVLILLIATLVIFNVLSKQSPPIPPGTVGNTAGNLNNSGLFCEYNGTVYFSNAFDHGSLYAMDTAEGNIRKLSEINACNILAGGDSLYFFCKGNSDHIGLGNARSVKSFNRYHLRSGRITSLTRDTVVKGQLVDNFLYLLTAGADGPSFYKMSVENKEKTILANYEINPACAESGIIYYNGTQYDHFLYTLDTDTDTSSELWCGNLWNPILQGDYIYYMDVAENYRLCRYCLSQNVIEVLTNDRVDCFNVGYGYIYYQSVGNAPALKCMRTDGSNLQVIAEGTYTNINLTSQYVYFQEYINEAVLYHAYLGSNGYDVFTAAKEATINQ